MIERSRPDASLLAKITVGKYDDYELLHPQQKLFERFGYSPSVSTVVAWIDAMTLEPIEKLIRELELEGYVLQGDDTGLKVLDEKAPAGATRGRLWSYERLFTREHEPLEARGCWAHTRHVWGDRFAGSLPTSTSTSTFGMYLEAAQHARVALHDNVTSCDLALDTDYFAGQPIPRWTDGGGANCPSGVQRGVGGHPPVPTPGTLGSAAERLSSMLGR